MSSNKNTSWQQVSTWYNKIVGTEGHYYHQHTVLPGVVKLLNLKQTDSLVDLGCGQGILSRAIPYIVNYLGLDIASSLISIAKKQSHKNNYNFLVKDVTKPILTAKPEFTHAAIVLALQNMENPQGAFDNANRFLKQNGKLVLVLNHPCFRIPRQSGWGVDEKSKIQYRWVNRYLSTLKIPIQMNPSRNKTNSNEHTTWSFHHSLQEYVKMLTKSGFVITLIEEWTSDKESVGKAAKSENRARSEFPLFMAIAAEKYSDL